MNDIAIISYSGIFPNADSTEAFAQNLIQGKTAIGKISTERLIDTALPAEDIYANAAYLKDISSFDHQFFNISLGEAEEITPHQRLLLQEAYKTFEQAGYRLEDLSGTNTSVYVGDTATEYFHLARKGTPSLVAGNLKSINAGRIARFFDLRGPAISIDTACSSTLTAISLACKDLFLKETDLALVCGVNVLIFPNRTATDAILGIDSPTGECNPFSSNANGTLDGETTACILLKPLDKAIADKDTIHAVIKGVALNQDAGLSSSITAPSSIAQTSLIKTALNKAGIQPRDVGFVEAHGTATKLGDPIEIEGLGDVFSKGLDEGEKLYLSAVKSNIGHTDSAAGMMGVIKVLLSFKHQTLLPSVNALPPSEFIDFEAAKVEVLTTAKPWSDLTRTDRRIAGISSFGLMGTNVHLLLEDIQHQQVKAPSPDQILDQIQVFCFSAKSKTSLVAYLQIFSDYLKNTEESLEALAFALNTQKEIFDYRLTLTATSKQELRFKLKNGMVAKSIVLKKKDQSCFLLFDQSINTDIEQIKQLAEVFPALNLNVEACTSLARASLLLQHASYQLLSKAAIPMSNMIGIGMGKLLIKVLKKEITLEEALNLADTFEQQKEKEFILAIRATKLIEKYGQKIHFLSIGFKGELGQAFENKSKEHECIFNLFGFNPEGSLNTNLQTLFALNHKIEPRALYLNNQYANIVLPSYTFDKPRCWIRSTEDIFSFDGVGIGQSNHNNENLVIEIDTNSNLPLLELLQKMWGEVLKADINPDDDFFELGGHSLNGQQLINRINEALETDFDIDTLFDYGTPEEMEEHLQSLGINTESTQTVVQVVEKVEIPSKTEHVIAQLPPSESYPISGAQRRMWILSQFGEGSLAYHIPNVMELNGDFDRDSFKRAIEAVIERHEILRTVFKENEKGEVRQWILPLDEIDFKIDYQDFRGQKEQESLVEQYSATDNNKAFDLENGSLLRAALLQLEDDSYAFYYNMHHIISDGWSMTVLINDVIAYYESFKANKKTNLPELRIQYKEYASWHNEQLQKDSIQKHKIYWLEKLAGELPVLELSTQNTRPAIKTNNVHSFKTHFSKELTQKLQNFSRENRGSLYISLLAAWNVLFYRYSGQKDIIIGSPVAGRSHSDLDNQIGCYLNTITLRNQIDSQKSFVDFYNQVKNSTLEAYAHQIYPFEQLVEDLGVQKDISRNAIFDVLLILQNTGDKFDAIDVNDENYNQVQDLGKDLSIFDLEFAFEEMGDYLSFTLNYNTDVYEQAFITGLIGHFTRLVENLMENPETTIQQVNYLSPQEEQKLLIDFNKAKWNYDKEQSLVGLFEEQAVAKEQVLLKEPAGNTQVYILDDALNVKPIGTNGNLYIAGDYLTESYFKNSELANPQFIDNPFEKGMKMYKTGDLARWTIDGDIDYLGRIDAQIKIRGHRIELSDIENHLANYPEVDNCAVTVYEKDEETYLVAYYVTKMNIKIDHLKEFLASKLSAYMQPTHYIELEEIPQTSTGKLNKEALPLPQADLVIEREPAATEREEQLVKIWSEILDLTTEEVGVNQTFFDLGGNSLKIIGMLNQVHQDLGVRLSILDVYQHQMIRPLAQRMQEEVASDFNSIEKADQQESYALSTSQKRMYFLYELDKSSLVYNMPQIFRFDKNLDVSKLRNAFQELVNRHEVFRTTFHLEGHEPVQKIKDKETIELTYRKIEAIEQEQVFINFTQVFDLENGPLLRGTVIETQEEELYLLLDMHHIISDGLSFNILYKELMALYQGENLPDIGIQYKDYSVWQQSEAQQEKIVEQKEFWLKEFEEIPEALELPTDFVRPQTQNFKGDLIEFELDEATTQKLLKISKDEDATMYMLLLTMFNVLLSKISHSDKIVVGTPIAGRDHVDLQNIIGLFINTLAIINETNNQDTFTTLLANVKDKVLASFENQSFPYESLVEELNIPRNVNRNPLFDVMFIYENFLEIASSDSTEGEDRIKEEVFAKFDLTLNAFYIEDKLNLSFIYATDLFKKETIERLIAYFKQIAEAIVTDTSTPIVNIDILSKQDRHQILEDFNATAKSYDENKTVLDLFQAQLSTNSQFPAITYQDKVLSFGELEQKSNQVAAYLMEVYGIKPNDFVGVQLNRSEWLPVVLLGIVKTGAAYVPIDVNYPIDRLAYIQEDCGYKVCIDTEALAMIQSKASNLPSNLPLPKVAPNNYAYAIYTSGSTGRPKGVLNNHEGLYNRLLWMRDDLEIASNDILLQKTPYTFDVSVWEFFMPLITLSKLVIAEPEGHKDPYYLQDLIESKKVNIIHFVPSMLSAFLTSLGQGRCNNLRHVICSGEALPAIKVAEFKQKFPSSRIHNLYGPTEAAIDVTSIDLTEVDVLKQGVSIGYPVANTQIYIVDAQMQLQPVGVSGELLIAGTQVALGYLNRPELTKVKFITNPFGTGRAYRTGDLAKWQSDGSLTYIGRMDSQIKLRGNRIELGEIENHIMNFDGIRESAVLVLGENEDRYLTAYFVSKEDSGNISVDEIKSYLASKMPDYMMPNHFVEMDSMPQTSSGKLNRKLLPEPELQLAAEYVAAANEEEMALVAIWADILNEDKNLISVTRNFFDLGGHSLKVIGMLNRIHQEFKVQLSVSQVFQNQSIRSLVQLIKSQKTSKFQTIEQAPQQESYVLSAAQKRMYFLYELDKSSLVYNMPQVFDLEKTLEVSKLRNAFQELVNRHEIFRTTFHVEERRPVQKIKNQLKIDLPYCKIEVAEYEQVFIDFTKPFDLENGPLLRGTVIETQEKELYLLLDMHHIISDGLSFNILYKELMALYQGEKLPELKIQYKDYSVWQQAETQQEKIAEQQEFWLKEFEEIPETLELPTDFVRPQIQSFKGGMVELELDEATTQKLLKISKGEGATMYMSLLTIFNMMLSKVSHSDRIVVGTPTSGRDHIDLQNIIGMFVNTLAIVNEINNQDTFTTLLASVKDKVLASFGNQAYPYESLVEELNITRDANRNPLFDVVFVYDNFLEIVSSASAEDGNDFSQEVFAKFDLTLNAFHVGDKLNLSFIYAADLFKKETIERLLAHLKQIAEAVVADTSTSIADIDILSKKERHQILEDFNATSKAYNENKTVLDLFQAQLPTNSQLPAISYQDKVLNFGELEEKSNQVAAYLIEVYGIKPNDFVGVQLDRSEWLPVVLLGIVKTAAAYVPIDVNYPVGRVAYIQEDCAYRVCIDSDELETIQARLSNLPTNSELPIVSPDNYAYAIYISGSTGRPKAVLNNHEGLYNRLLWMRDDLQIGSDDILLQKTPYTFDVSVWELFMPLITSSKLVIAEPEENKDPDYLQNLIESEKVNVIHFFPSMLSTFLTSLEQGRCSNLKHIICSGEALSANKVAEFKQKIPSSRIHNLYGPTEATMDVTSIDLTEVNVLKQGVSIGYPVANTQIYIVDAKMQLQPVGVSGELLIAGTQVALGYLNHPELTKVKFIANPFGVGRAYRTGDLAKWQSDGSLTYIGRMDSQIKLRGHRIELGEIENHIMNLDGIRESVVLAFGENEDKYLVAYFVNQEDSGNVSIDEIKSYMASKMPDYMIPSYFVEMDSMPQNSRGKLNKRALPLPQSDLIIEIETAATEREEQLVKIWSEILDVAPEKIGVTQNFFDIGGNSLKVIGMLNQIHQDLGIRLSVLDVYQHQMIRPLAQRMQEETVSDFNSIEKAEQQANYTLSTSQKRMYFLYELDKSSLVYNMPQIFQFDKNLNVSKLRNAFQELVNRHEIFRTTFHLEGNGPIQRIKDKETIELSYRKIEAAEQEQVFINFTQPFDLENGPLLRGAVIETQEEELYLLLDMHHIISDGLSFNILYKELMTLYQGESLPELRIQYKDYSVWQQSEPQQERIAEQMEFWLKEFDEIPEALNLPTDYIRPQIQSFKGGMVELGLDKTTTQKLLEISKNEEATMYMLLLTLFNVLLSKISHSDKIVVGTPIAGRDHIDLQNIIGLFVNTLAIVNEVDNQDTFITLLASVRDKVLASFENESFPYESLVDELNIPRNVNRNPLFDVMFVYENFIEVAASDSTEGETSFKEEVFAKFDLTLNASLRADILDLNFVYATDLFKKETIQRFAGYFRQIVETVIENIHVPMANIDVLPVSEREQILFEFNQTEWTYDKEQSLIGLFEQQVNKTPNNIALLHNGQILTYQELNERANQLTHRLLEEDAKEETVVGIMLDRSFEMVISIIAVLKTGAAYLPIDNTQPKDRVGHLIQEGELILLLTDENQKAIYDNDVKSIDVYDEQIYSQKAENLSFKPSANHTAYILFTSGSTGKPKGVVIKHQSLVNYITHQKEYFEFSPEERIVQFSPYYFDASVEQTWLALSSGAQLVLVDKSTLAENELFNNFLIENKVTHLHATPSFLESIVLRNGHSLKRIIAGGEVCKVALAKKYQEQCHFYNQYGPTEATITAIECLVDDSKIAKEKVLIGKPVGNTQIYILDDALKVKPLGVVGDIYIAGDCLATSYLKRPELTDERFIDNPFNKGSKMYKSGDLARWTTDGNVDFLGRADSQIKIRGYRIELGEIENNLANYTGIDNCAVTIYEKNGDKYLVAYFVAKTTIEIDSLKEYLGSKLPTYMLPTYFIALKEMPQTASGKLNKKALPSPQFDLVTASEKPTNETEEQLVEIWSEVLDLASEQIGVNQNFFDLGGHSLKVIGMLNQIHQILGVRLSISDVFQNQNIRSLALHLANQELSHFSIIERVDKQESYVLSAAQKRMYFLHALDKDSLVYNMPQIFSFDSNFEVSKLRNAFQELVARHEIFRTTFHLEGHEPVQKIKEYQKVELPCRKINAVGQDQAFIEFIQPFDLENGPLLRGEIISTENGMQSLMLDMHHIISDGLSMRILYGELMALCQGESLPPLKIQYKDYAVWQQSKEQQIQIAQEKTFWLEEFEDLPEVLELPTDFIRPQIQSFKGAVVNIELDEASTQKLQAINEASGTTMYMLVTTIFYILLNKISRSNRIVIGTPTAGRNHVDLQQVIGLFVNTLAMVNEVDQEESFDVLLERVKDKVLASFENQFFPYESLVDELNIPRNANRNPLFDVMLSYQNLTEIASSDPAEESNTFSEEVFAKFDLTLNAFHRADRLSLSFEYATDLFKKGTIERFAGYFNRIVKAITENIHVPVSNIDVLSAVEKEKVLSEFNQTEWTYDKEESLIGLFEQQVNKTPNNTALFHNGQALTYQELNEQANQLAHHILQENVEKGTVVGIMLDRSFEMVISIIAVLKTGAAYLPIDNTQPKDRVDHLIQEGELILLLTGKTQKAIYDKEVKSIDVYDEQIYQQEAVNLIFKPSANHTAYILFTSGSTGKPKGVVIKHQSLVNFITYQKNYLAVTSEERILMFSPYYFDASIEQFWLALSSGAELILIDNSTLTDNELFNDYLINNKVTHLDATPSFLESIELRNGHSLKRIVTGGEVCKAALARKYQGQCDFYNVYGPTEATISAIECLVDDTTITKEKVLIGKPVGNTQVYILDDALKVKPIGTTGQLYIAGDGLATSYLKRPELTDEHFIDNPFGKGKMYKTGDLARWTTDGNLDFLGRMDSQVKIRAYRIELGEIENHLANYSGIEVCAVTVYEKNEDKYLVAYFVARTSIEIDHLKEYLASKLPIYMQPTYYVELEEMPQMSSGKLNKKALPLPQFDLVTTGEKPTNETEEYLVEIWSEVLDLISGQIGITQSFFELGGHSLNAMKMLSMVNQKFGIDLPLIEIFSRNNIKDLGAYIAQAEKISEKREGTFTLLRNGSIANQHLFFIHDGGGDVQGYLALLSGIDQQYNCWGIRSSTLKEIAPQQINLNDLATSYIEEMKQIQPTGAYSIIGWSTGGVIAYEMCRQLQIENEQLIKLVLIDSQFQSGNLNQEALLAHEFTVQSEINLLQQFIDNVPSLSEVNSLDKLWEQIIQFAEQGEIPITALKAIVPQEIQSLIPNYDQLGVRTLVQSINTVRSLMNAADSYQATTRLNVPMLYVKAKDSAADIKTLKNYFNDSSNIMELEGNHFSIMQSPHVGNLSPLINQLILKKY